MLSFEGFTMFMLYLILAPVIGAITLLFLFIFEKRIDLLEHENKKIELEKELQQAKYYQLNQQIQPHFLFNTLNAILSLARLRRMEQLVRALEVFSLFLKFKYKTNEPLIPLYQEMNYTEYYIEIQQLRYGARLQVQVDFPDDLHELMIPPFILQTVVENAFKHGLEKKVGDAALAIRISQENGLASLQVQDNGPADPTHDDGPQSAGHGLDNIRRRLQLYYGELASLDMVSDAGHGTLVEMKWPIVHDPAAKR